MRTINANSGYTKHFIALCALFILGNAVIGLPQKTADKFTFLGFLISFAVTFIFYFLFSFVPLCKPLLAVAFLLSFWAAADTFLEFIKFINDTLLRETANILIVLPFVFVAVYFAFQKSEVVLKFSLVAFFFSVLAVIFFFAFTAKDFDARNIIIKSLPSFKNLYTQTLPYIKKVVLPSLLLVIYAKILQKPKKVMYFGMIAGNALLAVCLLNSILLFGSVFSGELEYPYASAISTVTFGNLFTRMDGFAYFIYFASCIIKITVCVYIIKFVIRNKKNETGRKFTALSLTPRPARPFLCRRKERAERFALRGKDSPRCRE